MITHNPFPELRRLIHYMAILLLPATGLHADTAELLSFHTQLRGYGARLEGTEEEVMAFDAVAERLNYLGLSYTRRTLDENSRGHSFSVILEATVPGRSSEHFILASPMEQGAFSTALLLEIAENLAMTTPQHTISLCFLGGERGDTPYHPYGSRYLIDTIQPESGVFALYIDAETVPETWDVRIGGNGVVAPYWLAKPLTDSLHTDSINHRLRGTDIHVANLGLQGNLGSYSPWLEAGIPSVYFQGKGSAGKQSANAEISRFVRTLLDLDHLITRDPEKQESTYLFLRNFAEMRPRYIRELPFVIMASGFVSLLSVLILLRFRMVLLNFKRFSRYWWTLVLLYFLVFLFLFLTTLIIEEILHFTDFPTLWTYSAGSFLFFKFTVIAALSLNLILLTHGIPFPGAPHFYSYTAVSSSFLLTLILMLLDITLAVYSTWITGALLLFAAVKNFKVKIFFLILASSPYIAVLAVVLTHPYMAVLEFLLLNRISGNLLNTLALLPLILALASLSYWKSHYRGLHQSTIVSPVALIINLAAIFTLIWLSKLAPFNSENPQPVKLIDNIDLVNNERWLELESPGTIDANEAIIDRQYYSIDKPGREVRIDTQMNRVPLEINSNSFLFPGRRTININLAGEMNPARLQLELNSDTPFTLHSASMPFEMASSGQTATIFIGDNPPFPFSFNLTISHSTDVSFSVTAVWNNPQDPPALKQQSGLQLQAQRIARITHIL